MNVEKITETADKLAEKIIKTNEIRNHVGHQFFRTILQFREKHLLNYGNYADLKNTFTEYNKNISALKKDRITRNRVLRKITQYTNNTLYSSAAYIEYIRKIHLKNKFDPGFSSEKKKVLEEIEKEGIYQLMRAIRNFATHESPLAILHNNSYSRNDHGELLNEQSILLKDQELFRNSLCQGIADKQRQNRKHGYDKIALYYYDSIIGKINLSELFEIYFGFLGQVHRKILMLLVAHHEVQLHDFLDKTRQLRKEKMLFNSEIPVNIAQERYLGLLLRKIAGSTSIHEPKV